MLKKHYSFDERTEVLTVYSGNGVHKFCRDMGISSLKFNYYTVIDSSIEATSSMFVGCCTFNQLVVIPRGVQYCDHMFEHCTNFNSPVYIPEGVTYCQSMFAYCNNFNFPVQLPDSIRYCENMFLHCTRFNQPMDIPVSVRNCSNMFKSCTNLNQLISIPDLYLEEERDISKEGFDHLITKVIDYRINPKYSDMFEGCPRMYSTGVPISFGGNCGKEDNDYR